MSLRRSLVSLSTRPTRPFSSAGIRYNDASASGSTSTPPTPIAGGFDALSFLTSSTSTSTAAASTSSQSAPPTIIDYTSKRGYEPTSLPLDVDPVLDLFTNLIMKHGRKAEAQGRISRLLALLQGATNQNPLPLLHQAVTLSSPSVRVVSMRKRAKTTQTPLAINERQRTRQGISWILKAAEKGRRGGVDREARIAREVLAVLEGNSDVFKWLEERHKVATANRSNLNTR